jgi:hypothetical protein
MLDRSGSLRDEFTRRHPSPGTPLVPRAHAALRVAKKGRVSVRPAQNGITVAASERRGPDLRRPAAPSPEERTDAGLRQVRSPARAPRASQNARAARASQNARAKGATAGLLSSQSEPDEAVVKR